MEAMLARLRVSRALKLRLATIAGVAVAAAVAHHFGILRMFVDPSGIANLIRGLDGWGYIVFVVAYTLQVSLITG